MTGEIPQPQEEATEYTPAFNLDRMSIGEAVALVSAVENARDPFSEIGSPETSILDSDIIRTKEALTEDLSRYPDADLERSMALFQALCTSNLSAVRSKAGFAISGLLRVAAEQARPHLITTDKNFANAVHLSFELLLDEDEEVGDDTRNSLTSAIKRGEVPAEAIAVLFGIIAGELEMVHGGEVEPRFLARRRERGELGNPPA